MSASDTLARMTNGGKAGRERASPTTSIAMCTYNGAAYLEDQLASFVKQTQLPDELVVGDDASSDNSLQVLAEFSKAAPFPVRVYRNEQRLGVVKNYEKAVSLCSGELIFGSDQDDVWMPEKMSRLAEALASNPGAGYVFSDALVVDETLRPMGYTMWQSIKFTPGQRRRFKEGKQLAVLLKGNVVTGSTMAFRAGLRSIILPMSEESVPDEWIALLASSAGMYGLFIDEPLVQHRQHPQQIVGGRKVGFIEQSRQAALTRGQNFESRLLRAEVGYTRALDQLALAGRLEEDARRLLEAKVKHLQVRQSIHKRARYARFFAVSRELLTLRYHRFSFGYKSAVRDLLL